MTQRLLPTVVLLLTFPLAACGNTTGTVGVKSSGSASAATVSTPTPCPSTTATVPPARMAAAMTYDAATRTVVLFSGIRGDGSPPLDDTWTWDGCNWMQQNPATSPPGRSFGHVAFDQRSRKLVLFGGGSANSDLARNDTWLWDGTTWQEAHPTSSPPLMSDANMDYDQGNQALLLWGVTLQGDQPTTWVWDGANWSDRHPSTQPPVRFRAGLASGARSGVLLFGGQPAEQGAFNDSWVWDGSSWRQLHPAESPQGGVAIMVHEDQRRDVLLVEHDGTWIWDGANWRHAASSPPFEFFRAIAYDPLVNRTILFGGKPSESAVGVGEFWQWDGSGWSQQ